MSEQTFYIHKNTIPPYEYDKVISFIESYEPLVSINHIIETYLVLKLLKTEKEFAEFLGVKYCSLTNSGSSANL